MVARKPTTIASTDTNTATTPAMPTMMTDEVPSRWGRAFRFMPVTARVCLSMGWFLYRPASASTMDSRIVRSAGISAITRASSTAAIKPDSTTSAGRVA